VIMQGLKIIAALRGFVNSTPLNTLSTEDKVSVRRLIDIITFVSTFALSTQMPNIVPSTSYRWIVYDLKDLATDLERIQRYTKDDTSDVEAALAHFYLDKVLEALILATRIGRRTWPSLSQ